MERMQLLQTAVIFISGCAVGAFLQGILTEVVAQIWTTRNDAH